jgi:hypothetical protein
LDGLAEILRWESTPWIWAISNDRVFFYVYGRHGGNNIELEVITDRGCVTAQPGLSEGKRRYSGTKRSARIHVTPSIAMGSAEGVITEVYAVVEAHQKGIRVSKTLVVSIGSHFEHDITITISR